MNQDMNLELKALLFEGAKTFGVELSPAQLDAFMTYKDMLLDWNTRVNLTGITEARDVILKHFVDSLTIADLIQNAPASLIDVGTGAGFPGIPLKIIFPSLRVSLLDSLDKRLTFLKAVISALSLDGIETIHLRAEDAGRSKQLREQYDFAVARALAPLPTLLELCMPFVKVGGAFIAMKGANAASEAAGSENALAALSSEVAQVKEFDFEQIGAKRTIYVVRKLEPLSIKYPRQAGKPAKAPL
ncbi:MAG: 16S rRNA (guanine(527)-N(7))-methyltransferase RsmG [Bacillota bacterium]